MAVFKKMKSFAFLILIGIPCISVVGCQSSPAPLSEKDIAAHHAMSQEFLDRVHVGDWVGLGTFFLERAGYESIVAAWVAVQVAETLLPVFDVPPAR